MAGIWDLEETTTSITGGECFASLFQSVVGSTARSVLQITQGGTSLTVRATDSSTGASCDYTGTASAAAFALNVTSCTASDLIGAVCPNGARRDIKLQTGGYNGSVNGTTASGTGAETFNVFVSGTSTPVGTLIVNSRFTASRR